MRTYNLEDRDVDVAPVAQLGGVQEGAALTAALTSAKMVAFAESVYRGEEPLAAQTDALAQSCNKAVGAIVVTIQALVDQFSYMPDLQQAMDSVEGG